MSKPFARIDNLGDDDDDEGQIENSKSGAIRINSTKPPKPDRPQRATGPTSAGSSAATFNGKDVTSEISEDDNFKDSLQNLTLRDKEGKHVSFAKQESDLSASDGNQNIHENVASEFGRYHQNIAGEGMHTMNENDSAGFWTEHENWTSRVLADKLFEGVRVTEPESAPRTLTSLNPPVFYKVSVSDMDGYVRRRYSDFEWLQNLLQSRFVGMVVPPLPPKVVGSGKLFLSLRMRGLRLFLEKITANAYLKSDTAVYSFFTEANHDQWETFKRQTTPFGGLKDNSVGTNGHEKWLQALTRYELPADSKTVLYELNRQVDSLSRQLSRLLQAAQGLANGAQVYSSSVVEFDTKFQDLLIAEMISPNKESKLDLDLEEDTGKVDIDNGRNKDQNEMLIDSMKNLGFCARDWSELTPKLSQIIDYFLLEAVRFEVGLVDKLQELLIRRREVIKLHDKSVQKKITHEREKKVAEHSHNVEQMNRLSKKIAEDNERVRNTYDHAIFITKGLFFSGVRQFASAKAQRLDSLKDTLCAAMKSYHLRMAKVWENNLGNKLQSEDTEEDDYKTNMFSGSATNATSSTNENL